MGIAKDGSKRGTFQPGVDLKGMDPSYAFFAVYLECLLLDKLIYGCLFYTL